MAAVAALCASVSPRAAYAGWNKTAAGTYEYNDTANWDGDNIDDIFPASLSIGGAQTITFNADRSLSGPWQFLQAGTGNLTLRGLLAAQTVTLNGDVIVDTTTNARTITFGSATAAEALNVALGSTGRTFTVATGDNATFLNSLTGSAAAGSPGLIKTGAGTLSLRGTSSSFTGNLRIDAGTLELVQNVVSATLTSGVLGEANNDIIFNGGTLRPNFNMDVSGRLGSGHVMTVNNVAGNVLDLPNRFNLGTANQFTGTGTLNKIGSGSLQFFAANDFSGTLNIQAGNISFRSTAALAPTAAINISGSGSLTVQTDTTYVFGNPTTISGNTTIIAGTSAPNSAGRTFTFGNLTVGANTVTVNHANINSGVQTLAYTGTQHTLTGTPTFVVNAVAGMDLNVAVNGPLTDNGGNHGINKQGTGTLTLAGDNTFSGPINITGGSVVAASAGALGTGIVSVTNSGQKLIIDGPSAVNVAGLKGLTVANGNTLRFSQPGDMLSLTSGSFAIGAITLDLSNAYNAAGAYTLIDGVGTSNTLGVATFMGVDTTNFTYNFGLNGTGDNAVLTVTAVPEPAAVGLLAIGALGLLKRQRRSR